VAPKGIAAPSGETSIRAEVENTADKFYARAKTAYADLDKATGGYFQRFENSLRDINQKLNELVSTGDVESAARESELVNEKASVEAAQEAAFQKAKDSGVDPALVENARQDFKKSQALYDLDFNVKKSTSGLRPDVGAHPTSVAKDPETLDPKKFVTRINALYDRGRLQEAVGNSAADKMLEDASRAVVQQRQVLRNQKLAKYAGHLAATGLGLGAAGYAATHATHVFIPGQGVSPVQ